MDRRKIDRFFINKSLNLAYDFVKKIVLLMGLEAHPSITVIPVKSPLTKGDSRGCAFFRAIPVPRFHEDMFHEDMFWQVFLLPPCVHRC